MMNFITLKGRHFNLNTVEEYEIVNQEAIILYFIRGKVELKYDNVDEFHKDKALLLQTVHNQHSYA